MALFVVIRSQKVGERAPRHETKLRRPRGRPSPMGHEELVSQRGREGAACARCLLLLARGLCLLESRPQAHNSSSTGTRPSGRATVDG